MGSDGEVLTGPVVVQRYARWRGRRCVSGDVRWMATSGALSGPGTGRRVRTTASDGRGGAGDASRRRGPDVDRGGEGVRRWRLGPAAPT